MAAVGCAGILVADTFCGPMRSLPEPGELFALDAMPSKAGGCAANTAICLGKQGVDVDVVGCLGRDAPADTVRADLERSGVGTAGITYVDGHQTSQTVILLVEGEDRRFIHMFGANRAFTVDHVDRDWASELSVLYVGGLCVMPSIDMAALAELLRFCRGCGVTTVVDVVVPQGADTTAELPRVLPHVDYFLPNDDEGQEITGRAEPLDQARDLLDHGAGAVVVTRGDKGAIAVQGDTVWEIDVFPGEAVDPSGSGDAFAAGVITGLLRGWEMPDLLRYGSLLGASATRAVGTTDGVYSGSEAEALLHSPAPEVRSRPLGRH